MRTRDTSGVLKNPYEHLRRDTRSILPAPWENYPILRGGYEVIEAYNSRSGGDYINLLVSTQDGRWVCGMRYQVGGNYGGFQPGRKWGDFDSRQAAILYTLGGLRAKLFECNDQQSLIATRALTKAIYEHRAKQLTLF